ncbi:hypothetical protein E8E11_011498 [Didymella keratinophila]|nr:hypothetical protein E8E11_011498 [Didymella keratinophila]
MANLTMPRSLTETEKRVHIHLSGGEVINIHEDLLGSCDVDWDQYFPLLSTDEKDEKHIEASVEEPRVYRTLVYYLYRGVFPDLEMLHSGHADIHKSWSEGQESHPLACNLALKLYTLPVNAVEDAMMSFTFNEYQTQRIAPSSTRGRQLYEMGGHSSTKVLFVDLSAMGRALRVRPNWPAGFTLLYQDNRHELRYFIDDAVLPYRLLEYYLDHNEFPKLEILRSWEIDVREDWTTGKERDPLACSQALRLYMFALSKKKWPGLADAMTTFLFRQYQAQDIAPDRARMLFIYTWVAKTPTKSLFVDPHFKFGSAPDAWTGFYKLREFPKVFLVDLAEKGTGKHAYLAAI